VTKTYSYPRSGTIASRLRLDWAQLRSRGADWLKESRRGLAAGTFVGFSVAVCLSLFVLLQALARRSLWFPSVQLTAWPILAGYFIAFVCAGAIVGILAPLLRWRVAAVLAGMVGGVLVYSTMGLATSGFASLWLKGSLQLGIGFGGPLGYLMHYQLVPGRRWSQHREILSIAVLGVMLVTVEVLLG